MQTPPRDSTLPPAQLTDLRDLLAAQGGTITSADLAGLGLGGAAVASLRRQKVLLRVGRGAFVDHDLFGQSSARERHALRTVAVARTWPTDVAVSHVSAAVLLDLPLPVVPERIHGCRTGTGQHRKNAIYTIHTGYADATATALRGVRVLEPRFVVMGVAEELGRDAGVMTADHVLHHGLASVEQLAQAAAARPNHPAHALTERVIELADGRTESPGETRSRLLLVGLGFSPVPQVEIRGADGGFIARVDFLLDGTRVVVEFDGMTKYGSHEDLVAEKKRELRLQREGYVVVRLVWADLAHPARVRSLIEAALAVGA